MLTENEDFDRIYKKYKDIVLRIAYKYSGDKAIAEDIFQETVLALYIDMKKKNYATSEEGYTNLVSWLCTTAKRKTLNYKKKMSHEVFLLKEGEDEEVVIAEPSRGSVEEEYFLDETEKERARLHEIVFSALMEKNSRWYDAIMLTCHLKLPKKDAAEIMKMSPDAFYVMLHRARDWIKGKFHVEYEELERL